MDDYRLQDTSKAKLIFSAPTARRINRDEEFERIYHEAVRNAHTDRSKIITGILANYSEQQIQRYNYKHGKKRVIFWLFFFLIITITIAFVAWASTLFFRGKVISDQDIIALVSSCVTYLTALISTFTIIVKYIFPTDEEKYFNDLVKTIIESDTTQMKNENEYSTNKSSIYNRSENNQ